MFALNLVTSHFLLIIKKKLWTVKVPFPVFPFSEGHCPSSLRWSLSLMTSTLSYNPSSTFITKYILLLATLFISDSGILPPSHPLAFPLADLLHLANRTDKELPGPHPCRLLLLCLAKPQHSTSHPASLKRPLRSGDGYLYITQKIIHKTLNYHLGEVGTLRTQKPT